MIDRHKLSNEDYSADSIIPGIGLIMTIAQRVRSLTLDYALGAAILGVVPIYGPWIPAVRLLILTILNLKMINNIGRFWGNRRDQTIGEILSCVAGILGSLALGLAIWIAILLLGLLIPFIDILARAIAYGILTYNIGRTVSRYYYSPQSPNIKALQKALRFQQLQQGQHNRL